jgi:hypothetical protein
VIKKEERKLMEETNKIVLTDINLPFESLLKLALQMIGVQIVIVVPIVILLLSFKKIFPFMFA